VEAIKMAEAATIHPPPGAGIPALRYSSCINATTNMSLAFCRNDTSVNDELQVSLYLTQKIVAIVVPLLFGIIVFVGLIGNALVSKGAVRSSYTECPTTYRTRHFFNNSKTNEYSATRFEQEYVQCVRNEEECVCSALQISLQYPH
jgi:hypothetical protein